jgi:hypothetical protein
MPANYQLKTPLAPDSGARISRRNTPRLNPKGGPDLERPHAAFMTPATVGLGSSPIDVSDLPQQTVRRTAAILHSRPFATFYRVARNMMAALPDKIQRFPAAVQLATEALFKSILAAGNTHTVCWQERSRPSRTPSLQRPKRRSPPLPSRRTPAAALPLSRNALQPREE